MSRLFAVLAVLSLTLTAACTTQPRADGELSQNTAWSVKADYTDTCSCQRVRHSEARGRGQAVRVLGDQRLHGQDRGGRPCRRLT